MTSPTLLVERASVSINATAVLHQVSLEVGHADFVAVMGSNGAGKSTLLRTISGCERITGGRILFLGEDITRMSPEKIVKRGLLHVPEGRHVFTRLSVSDNLDLGSYLHHAPRSPRYRERLAFVYDLFPRLQERRRQLAGTLSGGEQQMLAIGRALMAEPKLLMLDEPSLGLAPLVIEEVFRVLSRLNRAGLPVLLIEQNAKRSLETATTGYVLERGRIVLRGLTSELRANEMVVESYLGTARR